MRSRSRPVKPHRAAPLHEIDDFLRVHRRRLLELELDGFVRGIDARDADRLRQNAQQVRIEQHARRFGQVAEAITSSSRIASSASRVSQLARRL
jgi:hypothetical protein